MSIISSTEHIRDLFYEAPIPVAYLAPNGLFKQVNNAWINFLGFNEADLVEKLRIQEISHPQDVESNSKMYQKLAMHSKVLGSFTSVSRYLSKDGKAVWGQTYVKGLFDDNGNLYALLMFIIPLPNHGKFKVAWQPAETPARDVVLRPSITISDFVKDNWKWLLATSVAVVAFLVKMVFVIADILDRVGLDWKEVLF